MYLLTNLTTILHLKAHSDMTVLKEEEPNQVEIPPCVSLQTGLEATDSD